MTKSKVGISRVDLDYEIIKAIWKNHKIRYTDLKNALKVSDPTLWKHIKKLNQEKVIEIEQKGKEKWYRLSININDNSLHKFKINMESSLDTFFDHMSTVGHHNPNNFHFFINDISQIVSSYFFYLIFKSYKEKKDHTQFFDTKEMFEIIISTMENNILGHVIDPDEREGMNIPHFHSDPDEYFKEFMDMIENTPNYKKNFGKMFKILKSMYADEIHSLENPTYIAAKNFGRPE